MTNGDVKRGVVASTADSASDHVIKGSLKVMLCRFVSSCNCPPDNECVNELVDNIFDIYRNAPGDVVADLEASLDHLQSGRESARLLSRLLIHRITDGRFWGNQ